MKVQKKITIQGQWAKIKEDINNGDIIVIADEGKLVAGDYGERHVFKVQTKNGEKLLTFNQTSMNYLIDAFGAETNEWQGEKIKVWLVKSNVGGKMKDIVYLTAPNWIEGEDGFYPPNKLISKQEIPVVEDEDEDMGYSEQNF